jgi:hypothetical protein
MSAAQKAAQANFKKAIAYRKKTGCTLKQAFAHVKGGKVSGLEKVVKKGNKTTVLYTKKAKKKAAPKKKTTQGVLFGTKKKAATKKAVVRNYGSHKDTASHNVKISVMSGVKPKPTTILLAKKIANDTNFNDHTEAVLKLAKFLKDKENIAVLNAIKKAQNYYGHLPAAYSTARNFAYNKLIEKAKYKLPGADYELIKKSF